MAQYTVEDIEIIRKKSGISYEEAVNLLEYHNGSLARSLVDLEKNGRIKTSANVKSSGKGIFNFLFRLRVKVRKGDATVMNLSALFMIISLCVAPHLMIIALIVSLVFGYRINVERNSRDFEKDSFDTIVKNAKNNVQSTVTGFASALTHAGEEHPADEKKPDPQPAPQPRAESAASGTRPVNVQFSEGTKANVQTDDDGFSEVDIK